MSIEHKVNHVALTIDKSLSMTPHSAAVVQVVDNLVADLAEQSKIFDQETRLSVWLFNHGVENVVWDMDVLRFPSIAGLYRASGNTALIDAVCTSIDDMRRIPQIHGDHAMLGYTFTDGQENSSRQRPQQLSSRLAGLEENWTEGVFVPDLRGVRYAEACGFPAGSIEKWDPNAHRAVEMLGERIKETSRSFFEGRSQGVRGARSGMFTPGSFSAADVQARLTPITSGAYGVYPVPGDSRIDLFVESVTRRPYPKGRVYYQLTKPVTIQDYKDVLVEAGGVLYSGTLQEARSLLGLPDYAVKVNPRDLHTDCKVFVQSTSYNRKLIGGTQVVVLR
jgi:hypothetical protein